MIIRRIIFRTVSFLFHPVLSIGKNILLGTSFSGTKGNVLQLKRSLIKRSDIEFRGEGNTIDAGRCSLCNTSIFIRGKGHRLVIGDDCQLFNLRIKIIGENNLVYIGDRSAIDGGNLISGGKGTQVKLGEDCMISEGLDLWSTDTHSVLKDGSLKNPSKSIIIGNHVWIGKDVAILKGVTIGDNSIVGMRSLVTKDIRPGTLNVGSPSKEIHSGVNWSKKNPNN